MKSIIKKEIKNIVLEKNEKYVIISISHNKKTIIDIDDYEKIKYYKVYAWYDKKSKNYYCFMYIPERKKEVRLHRFITNCPNNMVVDHKDRNTLNNRKSNLRICKQQKNTWNSIGCNKTSKFKGVHKGVGKYKNKYFEAKIKYNGEDKFLGYFINEHNAAHAYNEAAKKYYGEFAFLNENLTNINPEDEIIYNSEYNNKSKYIGVSYHKQSKKYRARLKLSNREICIGYFNTPEEAAIEYNKEAIKYNNCRKRRLKLNRIEE